MTKPDGDYLEVHLNTLEEDAQQQPRLLFWWGQELAHARRDTKRAKNSLKLRFARMESEIRSNGPQPYGLDKLTEKSVESVILADAEYQAGQEELIELEYQEDVLDTFFRALVDKTKEIEVLSRLHGQSYWSKPDTSGGAKDPKRNRDIMERVNESLNSAQPKPRRKSDGKRS